MTATAPSSTRTLVDDTMFPTLALTGITVVAAISMGRLFEDTSFLGPVVLAAVVPHAVAWALRVWRVPGPVAVLAGVFTVVGIAVWVVLPHTTSYGIPWTATLQGAQDELRIAGEQFREVVAPTPATTGFVLACVFGTAVCALLADWAAFRMRALFEAAIPSFTLFLFSAILGAKRWHGLSIAAFLAALLLFLVVQQARLQGSSTSWFASRSRRGMASLLQVGGVLGVVVVVAALVAGPRIPGADDPPILRWRNSERPGPGNRTTVSPLVDIKGRLVNQSQVEVFTVRSNERSYWRLTSLDTFDGQIWSSNASYRPGGGSLPSAVVSRSPVVRATQRYAVTGLASIWLPAAYEPASVNGVDGASYNADSASIISAAETSDGLQYTVVSDVPRPTADQLQRAPSILRISRDDYERYTALPGSLSPRIHQLANQVAQTNQAPNAAPYSRAIALQQYLRSSLFRYNLQVQPGHDERALEEFLFQRRQGYCEQFAGAYAVLARAIGLPARVAVGFTPGELGPNGAYVVRGLNAHAWPEVYLEGYGWVAFEPTPGRGVPGGEDYTGQAEQQANVLNPSTATTAPPPTTAAPEQPGEEQAPTTVPDRRLESGGAADADDRSPWERVPGWIKWPLVLIVIGLVLWAAGIPVAKRLRRGRRRAAASAPGERVLVAWDETAEALALAGARRHLAETLPEYAQRAAGSTRLPDEPSQLLLELAGHAAAASYAQEEVAPAVADRASWAASAIEAKLHDVAGRRQRLRWALDPRPLRGTRRTRRSVRPATPKGIQ